MCVYVGGSGSIDSSSQLGLADTATLAKNANSQGPS